MSIETTKDIFEPEIPSVPDGWEVLPFNKAAKVLSDHGKRLKQKQYLDEGKIPVIDQGQGYIGGFTNDETMAFEGELPVILFGDHTRTLKYVDKPFAVGAEGIKILKPVESYDPKFFYYLLTSLHIPSRGYSRHFQFLKKFYFPLAPESQQKRIVAEIEKQFSRLDEAVANLKRVKANLKRYKAAVLNAAVEGKLTEEWRKQHPDVEPASKLLDRILAERRKKWEEAELAKMKAKGNVPKDDKWKKKYKEPVGPEVQDLPDLPDGWGWASPEQLASYVDYSLAIGPFGSNLKVSDYREVGVPLVFVRNIRTGIFDGENTKYVSATKAKELKAHEVNGGDILITKMGDPPGDACLYPAGSPQAIITADCVKWTLSPQLSDVDFFVNAINSQLVKTQILQITKGVAQLKISLARFKGIAIPLPPIEEKIVILNEVESRLTVIDAAVKYVKANLMRAERLRQSILSKAFSGGINL